MHQFYLFESLMLGCYRTVDNLEIEIHAGSEIFDSRQSTSCKGSTIYKYNKENLETTNDEIIKKRVEKKSETMKCRSIISSSM